MRTMRICHITKTPVQSPISTSASLPSTLESFLELPLAIIPTSSYGTQEILSTPHILREGPLNHLTPLACFHIKENPNVTCRTHFFKPLLQQRETQKQKATK